MCLYDRFKDLEKDSTSYYYPESDLKEIKPITNPQKAWSFIIKYFYEGKKETVLDVDEIKKIEKDGKHLHMISTYFMGILLNKMFEDNFNLKFGKSQNSDYDYKRTWFTTCLFHDFACIYETDKITDSYQNSDDCFSVNLLERYNIKHDVLEHTLQNNEKRHYSKETVKKYFYYRYDFCKKKDHGIIGGMLLYDRLEKNYETKYKAAEGQNQNGNVSDEIFEYERIVFEKDDHDHYAKIADSIISHNIWLATDCGTYNKYGLDELLTPGFKKISIKNNPLLFMLGFLDTIEPIKFFKEFSPEYIWKSIDVQSNGNSVTINVLEPAIFNHFEWFKKIKSLEEWLDVKISFDDNRSMIIKPNN